MLAHKFKTCTAEQNQSLKTRSDSEEPLRFCVCEFEAIGADDLQLLAGERDVWWEELSVDETDETRQRRRVSGLRLAVPSPGLGSVGLALQSTRGRRAKPDL